MVEKIILALGLTDPVSILVLLLLLWTWGYYIPNITKDFHIRIERLEKILEEYNRKFKEEFFDKE